MKLSTDDLLSLSQMAITAATEAGQLIDEHTNQSVAVQHKNGGDSPASQVVTEVDLLSEAVILKHLRPSCEPYELALLTEETTDDGARLEKDHFWCIDPLDGTLSFIESTPGYAVSIALVSRAGTPLIGVVYDPVTNTLTSAVQGQGVMRNGQAWTPALNASMQAKALTLVCDRGLLQRSNYPQIRQALETACDSLGLSGVKTIENGGGAVMNACWAMENQPACYFKFPKVQTGGGCLWDFAATVAIFHELNAVATDFHGQALELNRADSVFMNHQGVLFSTHQSLAKVLTDLG
jgi:3'(2'), 5'-bisphosphate nucleotidase/myo-inositol-1(or 4)-monophosphatase